MADEVTDYDIVFDKPHNYLGTKWCGVGNEAEHEDDFGEFEETDKCCRNHDMCECTILTKCERFGLKNDSPYTRLHCKCDYEFHECLKRVRMEPHISNLIGYIYFNLLNVKCFQEVDNYKNENDAEDPHTCEEDSTYDWFEVPPYLIHKNVAEQVSESVTTLMDEDMR